MGSATSALRGPSRISEVHVHFNGKKLRVVFNEDDYNQENRIPLQQFRTKLAKALGVPATSLLIYQLSPQKKLGNMGATLNDYGIKNGGDLLAVQEESAKPKPAQPKTPTEQIDAVVASVRTDIGERMDNFINNPPTNPDKLEQENRVLCEVILAKTISLDNVEVTTPEERQHRKQAVAKMQEYHNTVDRAMKSAEQKANAEPASAESEQKTEQKTEQQSEQKTSAVPEEKTEPKKEETVSRESTPGAKKKKNNKKKKGGKK